MLTIIVIHPCMHTPLLPTFSLWGAQPWPPRRNIGLERVDVRPACVSLLCTCVLAHVFLHLSTCTCVLVHTRTHAHTGLCYTPLHIYIFMTYSCTSVLALVYLYLCTCALVYYACSLLHRMVHPGEAQWVRYLVEHEKHKHASCARDTPALFLLVCTHVHSAPSHAAPWLGLMGPWCPASCPPHAATEGRCTCEPEPSLLWFTSGSLVIHVGPSSRFLHNHDCTTHKYS